MSYSFSKLQMYLKCPMQYRLEKIDKLKPMVPELNLHLTLGNCTHSALEGLYKARSDTIVWEEKQLLDAFENSRNIEIGKAVEINGGKNPFNQYDLEAFHSRGIQYMKYYHNKFKPFNQAIAMKMESQINFEMDEGIYFGGKIDRLDIDGDTLIINDYKTNKSLPKDGNNSIEDQITLYSIGVLKDYGKQIKNLRGRVIYLHLEKEHEWDISEEKINETKDRYQEIIREIEDRKYQYEKGNEDAFPTSGSNFTCDSCLIKPFCPKYKHMYMDDEKLSVGDMGEMMVKKIIEEYADANEIFNAYKIRKEMLGEALGEYAKFHKVSKLYGETKKLSITTKTTYSINKDTYSVLEKKLEEDEKLEDVISIDYNKLGKEFKEGNLEYENYKELITKKDSTYVSRTSDLKKEEMDMDVLGNEELI